MVCVVVLLDCSQSSTWQRPCSVVVSQIEGPQYRPLNTIVLTMGTPKGTPNFGKPPVSSSSACAVGGRSDSPRKLPLHVSFVFPGVSQVFGGFLKLGVLFWGSLYPILEYYTLILFGFLGSYHNTEYLKSLYFFPGAYSKLGYSKDSSIWESILGSPYFVKLPLKVSGGILL